MADSFLFYDLETSGVNPREARIMQFAAQRTDLQLQPIGQPYNLLIKLSDDVLPDPDAVLITGITPQQTHADGITEAEFLHIFTHQIAQPGTIFVGFNTIRFDDEFMRHLHYRNFYDPYEWQWQDNRSKWDILDVVRMTRALRPEGIQWPFDTNGKPTNRLEFLTSVNKLEHTSAHDALSDVRATIAVARLIYNKQTKLFEYLLGMRHKRQVSDLVSSGEPFVYSSGRYASQHEKTTVAVYLADHPKKQAVLVYDLRHDPHQFLGLSIEELAKLMRFSKDPQAQRLPVKTLQYNRCPAVAPLGVLNAASQQRLQIDLKQIQANRQVLQQQPDFAKKVVQATELLATEHQARLLSSDIDVDAQLYDGFFGDPDKLTMSAIRASQPHEMADFAHKLTDQRLKTMLPLYKARNHAAHLTDEERAAWEAFRSRKLLHGGQSSRVNRFFTRLQELAQASHLSSDKQYLLEELQLYGQSILPADS